MSVGEVALRDLPAETISGHAAVSRKVRFETYFFYTYFTGQKGRNLKGTSFCAATEELNGRETKSRMEMSHFLLLSL